MSELPDNVTQLADAFKGAERRKRKPRAPTPPPAAAAPPVPPAERPGLPGRLPDDSPVKALGTLDGMYFYLDALGQLRRNKQSEHGRLHILDLFPWEYLCETWPVWTKDDDGAWKKKNDFNHAYLAPVLMNSCKDKGVWDPTDRVRGCGSWIEDDGELVMHFGAHLWRALPGDSSITMRAEAGIKGDLLYPRRAPLPEPLFVERDLAQAGQRILDQLGTWNFKRGELDEKIVLGWAVHAKLGQATPWRPMMWVTGGKGTGKSKLNLMVELLLGDRAVIKPAATSQAYVYQKIGDSSLPVLLDEFEAKADNQRQQDVIELMRIAASGGELGRGGSENNPKTYTLKSCFAAFSILIQSLSPQDRSRMAIVELRKLKQRDEGDELDFADDHDLALGSLARWKKVGQELSGRILQQWPRYRRTFHAYFHALSNAGFDARAASQFGALGAGQDIALFPDLDKTNIAAWLKLLGAAGLAETQGSMNEPDACLQHLLSAQPDQFTRGSRETVAHYLLQAKVDAESPVPPNDPENAARVLAKIGIRIDPDPVMRTEGLKPVYYIAVSSTHPALGEIFKGTHWKGRAGAQGTWAQALRGLDGTKEKARQMRIDSSKHWVTEIMWEAVFPPAADKED